MKRGDVVLVLAPRSPASKARPCIVVQRGSTLDASPKVTVCPLTTLLNGVSAQRPLVTPTAENGLRNPSEVQVDWLYSFPKNRIGKIIGALDVMTMRNVDRALRRWLDL